MPPGVERRGLRPCSVRGVQFTVITTDGATEAYDGKYKVEDGVLKITPNDKNKPIVQLSPAFWLKIEKPHEEEPPEPKEVEVLIA